MSDPVTDLLIALRDNVMGVTESTLAGDANKTHSESMPPSRRRASRSVTGSPITAA